MISNTNQKVAIVTGGNGLLGREHCKALLEMGVVVFSADLKHASNSQLRGCDKYHEILMDVTSEVSIIETKEKILEMYGQVDILINNAAIDAKVDNNHNDMTTFGRLENFSIEQWNIELNVGLTGAFLCSKHFGYLFSENITGGVILNISSDLSVIAPDQRLYSKKNLRVLEQPVKPVTYSVIKTGLIGLTKYLATYWANGKVRVNALSPGGVYQNQPVEFVKKIENLIPLGRMAEKGEYKEAIQFLCSDASKYMTGQNIIIDGGRSIW